VITPLAGSGPLYAARVETQNQTTIVSIIPAISALTTISLPRCATPTTRYPLEFRSRDEPCPTLSRSP